MLKNKINGVVCNEKNLLCIYTEAFRNFNNLTHIVHVQESPIIYLHVLSGVRTV